MSARTVTEHADAVPPALAPFVEALAELLLAKLAESGQASAPACELVATEAT